MAKRARKRDEADLSAPLSPVTPAPPVEPAPSPEPAPAPGSGVAPDDARSLKKAGLFFALAVALLVVLKLLLGW